MIKWCWRSREIALALALGSEDFAEEVYVEAVGELGICLTGPGPCTNKEINLALALGSLDAAIEIRQEAEADLVMCQSDPGL